MDYLTGVLASPIRQARPLAPAASLFPLTARPSIMGASAAILPNEVRFGDRYASHPLGPARPAEHGAYRF